MRCDLCRGTGLVPAHDKRWLVMDCAACAGRGTSSEALEEQFERLKQRARDLQEQLDARDRDWRQTRDEQDAALMREGAL